MGSQKRLTVSSIPAIILNPVPLPMFLVTHFLIPIENKNVEEKTWRPRETPTSKVAFKCGESEQRKYVD